MSGIMGGAICDLQWKQVGKGDNSDLYLLCNFAKIFFFFLWITET